MTLEPKKIKSVIYCCSVARWCLTLLIPWTAAHQVSLSFTSPWLCWNSCPLSQQYHPSISTSVVPFSSCLKSFPASGYFPMSWLFTSGGQSIGASALASALPMNIQGWFPLGLTGLISLQSKGPSRVVFSITIWKHQFFGILSYLWTNTHICTWLLEKTQLWLYRLLLAKWYLYFLICCLGFVIAFLPRSKHLLISCLQSSSTVIWEPKKIKSVTVSTFPPAICHKEIIFMIQ